MVKKTCSCSNDQKLQLVREYWLKDFGAEKTESGSNMETGLKGARWGLVLMAAALHFH